MSLTSSTQYPCFGIALDCLPQTSQAFELRFVWRIDDRAHIVVTFLYCQHCDISMSHSRPSTQAFNTMTSYSVVFNV